jgi:hypothetical protein
MRRILGTNASQLYCVRARAMIGRKSGAGSKSGNCLFRSNTLLMVWSIWWVGMRERGSLSVCCRCLAANCGCRKSWWGRGSK